MATVHNLSHRPGARAARGAAAAALMVLLGACQTQPTKPDDAAAVPKLPPAFRNALETPAAESPGEVPGTPWWQALGSAELSRLMERALAGNPDLRIANLQLTQAKINADIVAAGGKPTLLAPVSIGIQAPGGPVGNVPVPGTSYSTQQSYQTSLQGRWRYDLWGEQAAMEDAAKLQVWQAVYSRDRAELDLVGSLTQAYVAYQVASDSIRLSRETEAVGDAVVRTTEERVNAGDATLDELEQRRAAQHVQREVIPALEQQREEARNTLAFLAGTVPGDMDLPDDGVDGLKLPELPRTLPSALLLQRPDIRAVEARMRAANANIEVARARLLPPIDLSVQTGVSALTVAQFLQPQSLFWSAVSSLAVTVFDGGKRDLAKAQSEAYHQEMIQTYARTVLQSVREVESALSGLRSSASRFQSQSSAVRRALEQYRLSSLAYNKGALDQSSLFEARRSYQRYLEDEQKLKGDYLKAYVALQQALGTAIPSRPPLPKAGERLTEPSQEILKQAAGRGGPG